MSPVLVKQLAAVAILAALILAVTKAPAGYDAVAAVVVVVVALAVVFWVGGGSAVDAEAVSDAVRRVAAGERPMAAPRGSAPETTRLLAEIEELYRASESTKRRRRLAPRSSETRAKRSRKPPPSCKRAWTASSASPPTPRAS